MQPVETASPAGCWQVAGRSRALLQADWRAALARRLGARPRRIGVWAELALAGARACLDDAGEADLPAGTLLRVGSLNGPRATLESALAQLALGFDPMPYTFLQSQPAVMLAALAQHLGWSGDAVLMNQRDPLGQLRLALCAAWKAGPAAGVLIGWVDEAPALCSHWLRLRPLPSPPSAAALTRRFEAADLLSPGACAIELAGNALTVHYL